MQTRVIRGVPTILVALLLIAVMFTAYTAQQAFADHQPADKVALAGSAPRIFAPGERVPLLHEQFRVSSPTDLIIEFDAECGIVTSTTTGDDSDGGPEEQFDEDESEGRVVVWAEVDGRPVPVATDDINGPGRVVLCHRNQYQATYESEEQENPECRDVTVTAPTGADVDFEDDDGDGVPDRGHVTCCSNEEITVHEGSDDTCDDGLDEHSLYQSTRVANGFSWLALNGGTFYDDPANGQNILDVVIYGDLEAWCASDNCDHIQAFVGHRTLTIQTVHASNDEAVTPAEGDNKK